jgi:osmotically inducible lipoprotein OsmB
MNEEVSIMNNWRRWIASAAVSSLALLVATGCTVGGAAAGGVIGHEATHSTAGTVGGAVAGGVVGYELGK